MHRVTIPAKFPCVLPTSAARFRRLRWSPGHWRPTLRRQQLSGGQPATTRQHPGGNYPNQPVAGGVRAHQRRADPRAAPAGHGRYCDRRHRRCGAGQPGFGRRPRGCRHRWSALGGAVDGQPRRPGQPACGTAAYRMTLQTDNGAWRTYDVGDGPARGAQCASRTARSTAPDRPGHAVRCGFSEEGRCPAPVVP